MSVGHPCPGGGWPALRRGRPRRSSCRWRILTRDLWCSPATPYSVSGLPQKDLLRDQRCRHRGRPQRLARLAAARHPGDRRKARTARVHRRPRAGRGGGSCCCAGGVGITPLRTMFEQAARPGDPGSTRASSPRHDVECSAGEARTPSAQAPPAGAQCAYLLGVSGPSWAGTRCPPGDLNQLVPGLAPARGLCVRAARDDHDGHRGAAARRGAPQAYVTGKPATSEPQSRSRGRLMRRAALAIALTIAGLVFAAVVSGADGRDHVRQQRRHDERRGPGRLTGTADGPVQVQVTQCSAAKITRSRCRCGRTGGARPGRRAGSAPRWPG